MGGGKEFQFQSQEDQELSPVTVSRQLILKMNSEDQTVDHTSILMENDDDTNLYVMSQVMNKKNTQTLKIVIKVLMTVYRHRTRHVRWCSHELWPAKSCDNLSCPALYSSDKVSKTMIWTQRTRLSSKHDSFTHTWDSTYEISCEHMKHTTIHRQNHLDFSTCQGNWQLHLDRVWNNIGRRRKKNPWLWGENSESGFPDASGREEG